MTEGIDTHCQSGELFNSHQTIAKVGTTRPVTTFDALGMERYAICNVQQMGKDVLGDRIGAICRNVGDGDSTLTSGGNIDVVKSGGKQSDIT